MLKGSGHFLGVGDRRGVRGCGGLALGGCKVGCGWLQSGELWSKAGEAR